MELSVQAQTGQSPFPFVRDANRPFVYLKFDHVGTGVRRNDNEPPSRVWLQFVNNCNVPILLHAYGVPDGSPAGELGVMDDVVPNRAILTITADYGLNLEVQDEPPTQGKSGGR